MKDNSLDEKGKRSIRYSDCDPLSRKHTIEIKPSDMVKVKEKLIGRSNIPGSLKNFVTDFEEIYRANKTASDTGTDEDQTSFSKTMLPRVSQKDEDLENILYYHQMTKADKEKDKKAAEEKIKQWNTEEKQEERRRITENQKEKSTIPEDLIGKVDASYEERTTAADTDRRQMVLADENIMIGKEEISAPEKRQKTTELDLRYQPIVTHAQNSFSVMAAFYGGVVFVPNNQMEMLDHVIIMGYKKCPYGKCGKHLRIPLRIAAVTDWLTLLKQNAGKICSNVKQVTQKRLADVQKVQSSCITTCTKCIETDISISILQNDLNNTLLEAYRQHENKNQKYLPKLVLDWELIQDLNIENAKLDRVQNLGQ